MDSEKICTSPASSACTLKHIVIMHGAGISLAGIIRRIRRLFNINAVRIPNGFALKCGQSRAVRRILMEEPQHTLTNALQKIIISQLLAAPDSMPRDVPDTDNTSDIIPFAFLLKHCSGCGIPITLPEQQVRSKQLYTEAAATIEHLIPQLTPSDKQILHTDQSWRNYLDQSTRDGSICATLDKLRDMYETGGDLDTVASAVLYGWWLTKVKNLTYGKEWYFDFINYHESFLSLKRHSPCQLYLADLPPGAFPALDHDIRLLAAKGVSVARFEDHHPYTQQQFNQLQQLQNEKLIKYLSLSGPLAGEELQQDQWRCGTDMVYESTLQNTPHDSTAVRELRAAAHAEDFVTERTALSRMLTTLIKGGFPKIELAEILLEALNNGSLETLQNDPRLAPVAHEWSSRDKALKPELCSTVYSIRLHPQTGTGESFPSAAMGSGSDVPAIMAEQNNNGTLQILTVPSVRNPGNNRNLPVGRACEMLAEQYPCADYLFYCYGTDLMVARRLNNSDTCINLGELMPRIGNKGDGGHSGAAVCRPSANPDFPAALLRNTGENNFKPMSKYIAHRLEIEGFKIDSVTNISTGLPAPLHQGGKRMLIILLAALILGLVMSLLFSPFRPQAVRTSNENFIRLHQDRKE